MNLARTSRSAGRRAVAALLGTLIAATLSVGALAFGHQGTGGQVVGGKYHKTENVAIENGGTKPVR